MSCHSANNEKELADCLYDDEISVKVAAYRTLADRAVAIGLELDDYSQSAEQGLKHDNPEIRRCSVKILIEALPDQFEALVPLLDDPDDLVRAQAYKALLNKYPEIWQSGIEDASSAVKREMFSALSECSSKFQLRDILSKCIEQKQPEALVELINAAPQVKEIVIRELCSGRCDLQSALIRLLALSSFVQKTT